MSGTEIKRLEEAIRKQRSEVGTPEEAKKMLKKLNVYHLLVPKGSQKKPEGSKKLA